MKYLNSHIHFSLSVSWCCWYVDLQQWDYSKYGKANTTSFCIWFFNWICSFRQAKCGLRIVLVKISMCCHPSIWTTADDIPKFKIAAFRFTDVEMDGHMPRATFLSISISSLFGCRVAISLHIFRLLVWEVNGQLSVYFKQFCNTFAISGYNFFNEFNIYIHFEIDSVFILIFRYFVQ